jgi:hypothetical protein
MGDDKGKDKYTSWKSQFENKIGVANSYMSKLRDVHNDAIKSANEKIDYDFKKIGNEKDLDSYADKIYLGIKKGLEKKFGIKLDNSGELEDTVLKSLGGATLKEIKELLKTRGADYNDSHMLALLGEQQKNFKQNHYIAVMGEHLTDSEEKKYAAKYFGIEDDLITHESLNPQIVAHMYQNVAGGADIKELLKSLKLSKPVKLKKAEKPSK